MIKSLLRRYTPEDPIATKIARQSEHETQARRDKILKIIDDEYAKEFSSYSEDEQRALEEIYIDALRRNAML